MKIVYKKLIVFVFIIFSFNVTLGQQTFEHHYTTNGYYAQYVSELSDGGFIVMGDIKNTAPMDYDFLLMRTDSLGKIQWAKAFTGLLTDVLTAGITTEDKGYVMVGSYGPTGGNIGLMVKTDSLGAVEWAKSYGIINCYPTGVIETFNKGYFIIGSEHSGNSQDVFAVKVDSNGNTNWILSIGRSSVDIANDCIQLADSSFLIVGTTYSFNFDDARVYLINLKSNGSLNWSKVLERKGSDAYGVGAVELNGSELLVVGNFYDSLLGNGYNISLTKIDSAFNISWVKLLGGPYGAGANSISINTEGKLYLNGSFGKSFVDADPFFALLDTAGNVEFLSTASDTNFRSGSRGVVQTKDLGYISVGMADSIGGTVNLEIILSKIDSNGLSGCNELDTSYTIIDSITFSLLDVISTIDSSIIGDTAIIQSSNVSLQRITFCIDCFIPIEFTNDTSICDGDEVLLSIDNSNLGWNISWSPGASLNDSLILNPKASPNVSTMYYVNIIDSNGCIGFDSILLTVNALPSINVSNDTTINVGGIAQLNASGGLLYTWKPTNSLSCSACPNPIASPDMTTTYYVTLTDSNGCSVVDSVTVFVNDAECPIFIPNTITPNGDGVNDSWVIDCIQDYPDCIIRIYNRWGNQIYNSKGYANDWSGTRKNKELPFATYFYIIDLNNGSEPYRGSITVLR